MSIETLKALDIVVVVFVTNDSDKLKTTYVYDNKMSLEDIKDFLGHVYSNDITILNVSR
jgi:hypothetical protein